MPVCYETSTAVYFNYYPWLCAVSCLKGNVANFQISIRYTLCLLQFPSCYSDVVSVLAR